MGKVTNYLAYVNTSEGDQADEANHSFKDVNGDTLLRAEVRDIAVAGDGSAFIALIEVLGNIGNIGNADEDQDYPSEVYSGLVPIAIGQPEAMSIAMAKNGESALRPLTHDLIVSMLEMMNAELSRIEISSLEDGIFYSKLIIEHRGIELEIDARPSDAMALAVRLRAPIWIAAQVVMAAGMAELEPLDEDDEDDLPPNTFDTVKA
ncbi:MAG: bifunctional nuclease family protein [Deinococcales bacterium]